VISGSVILVVGIFQLAFIGAIVWLLLATHGHLHRRDIAEREAPFRLREPLADFLLHGKSAQAVADELRRLPPELASRPLERLGGSVLARQQMEALGRLVRNEEWVDRRLAEGTSRHWWKRLAAARLMPMVYSDNDALLFSRLVTDPHPAVAAAATAAIARYADSRLVEKLVLNLPNVPPTLRLQQMYALRSHAEIAGPLTAAALGRSISAHEIQLMVQLGEILSSPRVFRAIIALADHPDPNVRASVARSLRAAFVPGAGEAARKLLTDPSWKVRAAAARAIEGLRFINAIPELREGLCDAEWWVRFRSAGALAALGEPGSIALEEAIVSDDPYASEMAIAIGGLSEVNRLDISG